MKLINPANRPISNAASFPQSTQNLHVLDDPSRHNSTAPQFPTGLACGAAKLIGVPGHVSKTRPRQLSAVAPLDRPCPKHPGPNFLLFLPPLPRLYVTVIHSLFCSHSFFVIGPVAP